MLNLSNFMPSAIKQLKHYGTLHAEAFRSSFRNLSQNPFSSLLTTTAIGLCLTLPLAFYLFISNFQQISQQWQNSATLSVYIQPKTSLEHIKVIEHKIKHYHFVEKVIFTSADDALNEFRAHSDLNDILELLPENPLPAVLHVEIDSKRADKDSLAAMKAALLKEPSVVKAAFDYEWIEKMNAIMHLAKILLITLFGIIGVGVVLVVSNTIRLSLEHHRDEIEVMYQIGATLAFVLRPFLYRGILYAMLGGILALLIVVLANSFLEGPVFELSSLFEGVFHLEKLGFYDTVMLLAGCAALGWLGAMIAFLQQHRVLTSNHA
jgi:cell division transport system permease protein